MMERRCHMGKLEQFNLKQMSVRSLPMSLFKIFEKHYESNHHNTQVKTMGPFRTNSNKKWKKVLKSLGFIEGTSGFW